MSKTPRIIGIALGILAGTFAAFLMRANTSRSTPDVSETNAIENFSIDPTPDIGQRKNLKLLVDGAKLEPSWLKEFELTERSGKPIKSSDLKGEPYVACFFFSTCPGTCTRQSNKMQLLQNKYKGKPIRFVSISVDPEIDTPEVLAEYADKFGADKERWLFLSGPLDYTIRVGTEKFFLGGLEKRGHPDRFCLMNSAGDIVGAYTWLDQEEFDQLIIHINELLASEKNS